MQSRYSSLGGLPYFDRQTHSSVVVVVAEAGHVTQLLPSQHATQ